MRLVPCRLDQDHFWAEFHLVCASICTERSNSFVIKPWGDRTHQSSSGQNIKRSVRVTPSNVQYSVHDGFIQIGCRKSFGEFGGGHVVSLGHTSTQWFPSHVTVVETKHTLAPSWRWHVGRCCASAGVAHSASGRKRPQSARACVSVHGHAARSAAQSAGYPSTFLSLRRKERGLR